MRSRVASSVTSGLFSKAQKRELREEMKASEEAERQENSARNSRVLKITLGVFCYVLHKRYRYTTKTLQSIIDEAFGFIMEADQTKEDWAAGIKFWIDRMGLKI